MAVRAADEFRSVSAMFTETTGMAMPGRPTGEPPQISTSVADMSEEDIMSLWTSLTAWANYLSVFVSEASFKEKRLQKMMESVEQRHLLSSSKVTVARAEAKTSPEMERLVGEWLKADAYKSLMSAMFGNIERDIQLLSRELTRRTSAANMGRRTTWGT